MIDISIEEYNRVSTAVESLCPNSGQLDTDTPPGLPYLLFEQIDNPTRTASSESGLPEYAVMPVIQLKVYTNGEASLLDNQAIMELANDQLVSDGFVRTYGPTQIKNVLDNSIICFCAKFKAVVEIDGTIYNP